MLVPVPAVGLGFLVVVIIAFAAGWMATAELVGRLGERKKGVPIMRRYTPTDEWTEVEQPDRLSEEAIEKIALIGGGIAAVLAVLLLLFLLAYSKWTTASWYVLTAIGFIAGISTIVYGLSRRS